MNHQFFLCLLGIVDTAYAMTLVAGRATHTHERDARFVRSHRLKAYAFLSLLVAYVLFVEAHVRAIGGSVVDTLFCVHMCMAVPLFATSFLLVFPLNGTRSSNHRRLAYLSLVLMIGVNSTGIPLILRRF